MLTVSQLAKLCDVSRTTVLYYESVGLLQPCHRSQAGYRLYGEKEIESLRKIRLYRSVGLPLRDIQALLAKTSNSSAGILVRRLSEIAAEIEALREHQLAILKLLHSKTFSMRIKDMTKEKWVEIMKNAGFSEPDMTRWHQEFERTAPQEHQEFLTYLHISKEEIQTIRQKAASSLS